MPVFYGTRYADDIFGTNRRDVIYGYERDDYLVGRNGRDDLYGGSGDDVLRGDRGADFLYGNPGYDAASYSRDPAGVTVDLAAGRATDGWGNTDRLFSIEDVFGSSFDDVISGDRKSNFLNGRGGSDEIDGGRNGDQLVGGTGADNLSGQGGGDDLIGGRGRDKLVGGSGSDELRGGGQSDVLNGGRGNDLLIGNGGSDTFKFSSTTGDRDTIADFKDDVDILQVDVAAGTTVADVMALASNSGGDVIINFGGGNVLTVENITKADLQDDIVLV